MRNLRCGSEKHRFLDIKIGQKTAQVVPEMLGGLVGEGWCLKSGKLTWMGMMVCLECGHAKRTTPDLARPGGKGNLAWRRCGRVWWMALQIRAVRAFVWRSGGWVLQGLKPENQKNMFPQQFAVGVPQCFLNVSALFGMLCPPCWAGFFLVSHVGFSTWSGMLRAPF